MPSKSKGRKGKKSRKGKKYKQRQVKQQTRKWLEFPLDLMMNILRRLGVVDILKNAPNVCTTWREICKDPAMWRTVYLDSYSGSYGFWNFSGPNISLEMCMHVVERSQGQLVDVTLVYICDSDFLEYVADRSSQLQRLEIVYYGGPCRKLSKTLKKLSLLKELSLVKTCIEEENIEVAGCYCPFLRTLKVNQKRSSRLLDISNTGEEFIARWNRIALAIGKILPELTHLELIGNEMTNVGLEAILDGCRQLESLDLRRCFYVDLKGDLSKRCSQQIKHLKLPHDSLEGYLDPYNILDDSDSDDDDDDDDDDDYDGYPDYDYDGYPDYDDDTSYGLW